MLLWIFLTIAVVLTFTIAVGRVRDARDRRRLDCAAAQLDQVIRGLVRSERPPSAH